MNQSSDTAPSGPAEARLPFEPLPFEPQTISFGSDDAPVAYRRPGAVTLEDRQGVWIHSFKCSVCDLEFALFSWLPNRHNVGRTFCPECGERTPMLHWLAQTSANCQFDLNGPGTEICQMSPLLDGPMLNDSIPPGEDRYETQDELPHE